MILEHYAEKPVTLLPRVYDQITHNGKPHGLWLSVKGVGDWKDWCEGESFRLERLAVRHEATLGEGWDILVLDTIEKLIDFNRKYGKPLLPGHGLSPLWPDWERVQREYDGVLFAPYHYELRWHIPFSWYYSLDVPSACIWNIEAIETWKVVNENPVPQSDEVAGKQEPADASA